MISIIMIDVTSCVKTAGGWGGWGGKNVVEGTGEAEIRNAQLLVAKRAKPNCILGVLQLLKRASLTPVALES